MDDSKWPLVTIKGLIRMAHVVKRPLEFQADEDRVLFGGDDEPSEWRLQVALWYGFQMVSTRGISDRSVVFNEHPEMVAFCGEKSYLNPWLVFLRNPSSMLFVWCANMFKTKKRAELAPKFVLKSTSLKTFNFEENTTERFRLHLSEYSSSLKAPLQLYHDINYWMQSHQSKFFIERVGCRLGVGEDVNGGKVVHADKIFKTLFLKDFPGYQQSYGKNHFVVNYVNALWRKRMNWQDRVANTEFDTRFGNNCILMPRIF